MPARMRTEPGPGCQPGQVLPCGNWEDNEEPLPTTDTVPMQSPHTRSRVSAHRRGDLVFHSRVLGAPLFPWGMLFCCRVFCWG